MARGARRPPGGQDMVRARHVVTKCHRARLPDKDRPRVQTALNLRDGEKVVVGTASIRNRALVIVLTASVVK